MNFIQKLLLPKVAGPIAGVLLLLIAALGVTTYVQSQRIESLSTSLTSVRSEMGLWKSAADNYRSANLANESIIKKQTASIKALKEKSDAAKIAYQTRLEAGRSAAAEYRADAKNLLMLDAGVTDELGLCRAARDLLEKELTDDI